MTTYPLYKAEDTITRYEVLAREKEGKALLN